MSGVETRVPPFYVKQAAGQHVPEVSDAEVGGEQLPIKRGVVGFGRCQLPRPEFQRPTGAVGELLQDGADAEVAGVFG